MMVYNPVVQLKYISAASRITACFLTSLFLVNVATAGIRAPGKYSGVVFFDRWGGCIQINPGDGLIKRFNVIGSAPPKQNGYTVEGTKLEAQPIAIHPPFATVTLTITNEGGDVAKVNSSEIGFALLSQRTSDDSFSPSNGPSTAVITRTDVLNSHSSDGAHSYVIADKDMLPASFTLAPHGSKTTKITFMLPQGSYQFLPGYGGGVHENYLVVSNPVSIDFFK